jgi:hypothetical protein
MLHALLDTAVRVTPDASAQPWRQEEQFFEDELPQTSKVIQKLYADRDREMPTPMPGIGVLDALGNRVEYQVRGGHRYMLARAEWHGLGYDLNGRFDELSAEYVRWRGERSLFVRVALACVPGLRALYL